MMSPTALKYLTFIRQIDLQSTSQQQVETDASFLKKSESKLAHRL